MDLFSSSLGGGGEEGGSEGDDEAVQKRVVKAAVGQETDVPVERERAHG